MIHQFQGLEHPDKLSQVDLTNHFVLLMIILSKAQKKSNSNPRQPGDFLCFQILLRH
jgi:hypothetical protein